MDIFVLARRHHRLLLCILLAGIVFAAFSGALGNGFIDYDDNVFVTRSRHVKEGLTRENIVWALWTRTGNIWHPLTWLSHMLDVQLFGLEPAGHHLTSILLHAANAVLFFLLLVRLTGRFWRSALAAALFGLHPLRVESVAWVAERKDVLSSLFWLLTLLAYFRYTKKPAPWRYAPVVACYGLALMSKPMVLTLPAILLLLDYWPVRRHRALLSSANPADVGTWRDPRLALLWDKIPLFAMAALSGSIHLTVIEVERWKVPDQYSLLVRLANIPVSYVHYLQHLLWPTRLAVIYPHPGSSVWPWQTLFSLLLLAALTAAVLALRKRRPYLVTGWFWYLIALTPVLGVFQVGRLTMTDHFTYIPVAGLFILIAWLAADLAAAWRLGSLAAGAAAAAVLVPLFWLTRVQTAYWRDDTTLFSRALEATSDNWLAHNNLGVNLAAAGDFEGAIGHYRAALKVKPWSEELHDNLGLALSKTGRHGEAMFHFRMSLTINPLSSEARDHLGLSLEAQGRVEEALAMYREALAADKENIKAWNNLGVALALQGKLEEAEDCFNAALMIDAAYAGALLNLGLARAERGLAAESMDLFKRALLADPALGEVSNAIGNLLSASGDRAVAADWYRRALEQQPDNFDACLNLAGTLVDLGRRHEAETYYRRAVSLRPESPEALNCLGCCLAELGKADEAEANFRKALSVKPDFAEAAANLEKLTAGCPAR